MIARLYARSQKMKSLFFIGAWLGLVALASHFSENLFALFHHSADPELLVVFFGVAIICLLSFITFYLSHNTPFPSFVVAIFFGIAAKPLLTPMVEEKIALAALVSIGATLILFQGGLETSFKNFRRLFWKIFMLAFPGVIISAFLLAFSIITMGNMTGIVITTTVAILLGAVLASTDPAAVIPLLQGMKFKDNDTKDIIVSESAMNDVVGALLTLVLVSFVVAGTNFTGLVQGFSLLFSKTAGFVLLQQVVFGLIAGVLGFYFLKFLTKHKTGKDTEYGADAAFFVFVPIISFTGAMAFGGSGYLAAFLAGLVFHVSDAIKHTEHFFNHMIDGFAKPIIFLLLGALVDIEKLIEYAPVGILVALVFIFVLRPLMVFLALAPFHFWGKERLTTGQLLFISFIRETGAIPAVLLVTIVSSGIPDIQGLVPVGMWVILATLIIQPPLTPWVARKVGVLAESKNA